MKVWQGWGIIVPFIFVAVLAAMYVMVENVFLVGYFTMYRWPILVSLCLSATLVWFLGRHLNRVEKAHSFFFLRLEYWAFVFMGIDIVMELSGW